MAGDGVVAYLSEEWFALRPHVVRCKAMRMDNSGQCRHLAIDGAVVCQTHGGAAPGVKRRAAERIVMAADDAATQLIQWMNDDKVPIQERRKIAETLLDRAGISAGRGADVTVTHRFEQTMQDIVIDLDGPDDVEDAEVVVETPAVLPEPEPLPDNVVMHSRTSIRTEGR